MPWTNLTQQQAVLYAAAVGAAGAILGGTIAALLTQLIGARGQRRRQWDELRHVAYAKVTEAFHAAWAMYDEAGRLRVDRPVLRRAADELLSAYCRAILLTRKTSTADALEMLHDTAQDLWDRPAREWTEIDNACRGAEWIFRRQARAELGLSKRRGLPSLPSATTASQPLTGALAPTPPSGSSSDTLTANVASADEQR